MSTAGPELRIRYWVPVALLAGGTAVASVAAAAVLLLSGPVPEPQSTPVTAYTVEDLSELSDTVAALAESRLTPPEREAVEEVAAVLDDLATGEATIEPSPPTPPPSTSTTRPPPTTTTAVPAPTILPEQWADILSDDYPTAP